MDVGVFESHHAHPQEHGAFVAAPCGLKPLLHRHLAEHESFRSLFYLLPDSVVDSRFLTEVEGHPWVGGIVVVDDRTVESVAHREVVVCFGCAYRELVVAKCR